MHTAVLVLQHRKHTRQPLSAQWRVLVPPLTPTLSPSKGALAHRQHASVRAMLWWDVRRVLTVLERWCAEVPRRGPILTPVHVF